MDDFMLFHKDYAPTGRIFNFEDGHTEQGLAKEGWVDDPAKIGVNVWGPQAEGAVARKSAQFQRGELPPIGEGRQMTQAEIDEARDVLAKQNADEAFLRGDSAHPSYRQGRERAKDMKADAERKADAEPELQIQVPADTLGEKEKIKAALATVDRSDANNLGSDGRVRMAVLNSMLGFTASAAERDEAQAELDAAAANTM